MSGEALIIIGLSIVVSLAAVIVPFVQTRRASVATLDAQKAYDELVTDYERILATIRDLDEDYNTGKLRKEVYDHERNYWTEKGVAVLRVLETYEGVEQSSVTASIPQNAADDVLEDAIENAIRTYRQAKGVTA